MLFRTMQGSSALSIPSFLASLAAVFLLLAITSFSSEKLKLCSAVISSMNFSLPHIVLTQSTQMNLSGLLSTAELPKLKTSLSYRQPVHLPLLKYGVLPAKPFKPQNSYGESVVSVGCSDLVFALRFRPGSSFRLSLKLSPWSPPSSLIPNWLFFFFLGYCPLLPFFESTTKDGSSPVSGTYVSAANGRAFSSLLNSSSISKFLTGDGLPIE